MEELETTLNEGDDKKTTERLMLAIPYKQSVSVPMTAEWCDFRDALLYRSFNEIEEQPPLEAIVVRITDGGTGTVRGCCHETFSELTAIAISPL